MGPWNLALGALEIFGASHICPWLAKNRGATPAALTGRIPTAPVPGGEGPGVEELEEVRAHLWVILGHGEVLGGGGSTEKGGRRWWSSAAALLR
jgi:hypothetical protein